ncbi:MAG: HAD family hydrolase [Roseovarius sp.]
MTPDLIFDFDGVIADTRDALFAMFQDFVPDITPEDFAAHFDGNVYDSPRIKFTKDEAARLHDAYCERLTVEQLSRAVAPIRRLTTMHRLFIISSGDERGIARVLKGAGIHGCFQAVYGHNTHTSKVAKFKMIRDQFNLRFDNAVFVTDTLGDLHEAHAVSLTTIAETFGFHDRGRLEQGAPHMIVDTWEALETAIAGLGPS